MDTGQRCRRRPRPTRDRRPLHAADVTAGRIDLAASIDLAACPLVSSHHVFHVKRRPRNCVRRGGQLGSWVRHRPRSTDRHSVGCWPSRTVHRSAARRHPDSTVTPNPPDVGQPCSVAAARPGGSSRGLGDSSHEVRARTSQVAKSRLAESRSPKSRFQKSRAEDLPTDCVRAWHPTPWLLPAEAMGSSCTSHHVRRAEFPTHSRTAREVAAATSPPRGERLGWRPQPLAGSKTTLLPAPCSLTPAVAQRVSRGTSRPGWGTSSFARRPGPAGHQRDGYLPEQSGGPVSGCLLIDRTGAPRNSLVVVAYQAHSGVEVVGGPGDESTDGQPLKWRVPGPAMRHLPGDLRAVATDDHPARAGRVHGMLARAMRLWSVGVSERVMFHVELSPPILRRHQAVDAPHPRHRRISGDVAHPCGDAVRHGPPDLPPRSPPPWSGRRARSPHRFEPASDAH